VKFANLAGKGEGFMTTQNMTLNAVDQEGKWLYRVGGISALAVGLGYIIIIPLYLIAGLSPSGGEAKLSYLIASVGPFLISALDVTIIIVSLLTTFWFLFAGHRLYRFGQSR